MSKNGQTKAKYDDGGKEIVFPNFSKDNIENKLKDLQEKSMIIAKEDDTSLSFGNVRRSFSKICAQRVVH